LEDTLGEQFTYRYLLLRSRSGGPIALQPLIITTQDLLAGARAAITRLGAKIRSKWPRFFRSRMLMAGCVVGEGYLGVIPPHHPQEVALQVAAALDQLARRERISIIAFKEFPASERDALTRLESAGYTRLDGFPPLKLDLNFESFDDYLQTRLSKGMRKSLRRKFRETDRATPPIELQVHTDAEQIIDEVYPLYLNVAQRSDVTFEVFTRDYFLEAARRMPGRFRYFAWRYRGRAVAFAFCTIWNGTIYDNDIGLDYEVAHDLHLYYVTFRDVIGWALRNGMTRYCTAPFHYDAKLHLRLQPTPVDIYVRHRLSPLNALLRLIAPLLAPAKSDPALRRYMAARLTK
jgi:predicted N-acyltransferase